MVAKDLCKEVSEAARAFHAVGSLAVSSLWSGGISGQGTSELEGKLELESYFYN